jgi:ubiquinone/menaquinone biosynthesis C-methylase UbiE
MWPVYLFWVERGVMGTLQLGPDDIVLDCCCGEGYFQGTFWQRIADHSDAVDRDDAALGLARKVYSQPTIRYTNMDIVENPIPGTDYDVVVFLEAIRFRQNLAMRQAHG